MENINFDLDIDKESLYVRVPKRKAYLRVNNPRNYFMNISKRIIEKYIWEKDKSDIIPHGDPVHIDIMLEEIEMYRNDIYSLIKEKYIGRNVVMEFDSRLYDGYIEDISLEDRVECGSGNVLVNLGFTTATYDFPLEQLHRIEVESEIGLFKQKWHELNYPDLVKKEKEDLEKSIKLEVSKIRSEKDLEKYLKTRLYLIEEGLRLIMTQCDVNGGIIDILARDKNDRLCIIELKVNGSSKDIIWQCMYYPLQFKDEIGLRMITIAPNYHDSIKVILDKIPYVEMMTYEIDKESLTVKN